MFPEIERFNKWLRCRSPHTTTHVHYTSDVKLFFAWANQSPSAITCHDVDAYIAHCRGLGHAVATINRRLAALRCFYGFLDLESDDAPANPVRPRRHAIRKGSRLPRDAKDADVEKLLAIVTAPRDRAILLSCCGAASELAKCTGSPGTTSASNPCPAARRTLGCTARAMPGARFTCRPRSSPL
jgi:site-specific recombinase XerC